MIEFNSIKEAIAETIKTFEEVYPEVVPSKTEMIMESFEAGMSNFNSLLNNLLEHSPDNSTEFEKDALEFTIRKCTHLLVLAFKPRYIDEKISLEERELLLSSVSMEDWYEDYLKDTNSVTVLPYEKLTDNFRKFANKFYFNKKEFDPELRDTWFFFKGNKIIMVISYSSIDETNTVDVMCEPDSKTSEVMSKTENLDQFVTYIDKYNEENVTD